MRVPRRLRVCFADRAKGHRFIATPCRCRRHSGNSCLTEMRSIQPVAKSECRSEPVEDLIRSHGKLHVLACFVILLCSNVVMTVSPLRASMRRSFTFIFISYSFVSSAVKGNVKIYAHESESVGLMVLLKSFQELESFSR